MTSSPQIMTSRSEENPEPRGCPRREFLLGRAEAFLLRHLTTRFCSRDLCAAVNLSERAVQKLFHEEYGLTPRRWHQLHRMQRARADLLHGDSRDITQVASAWGFSELGRFSVQYRELFGERPSETLRRRRESVRAWRGLSRRTQSIRGLPTYCIATALAAPSTQR